MGAMAALAGCAGLHGAETGKFAMNASTLRGYNLSLLDQMKAMALSGFRGYEPWMKDIRAAKADGTLGDVCRIARDSGVSFINGIAFGQWVNPDPKIRAAGLDETKRDMALLAEIGCPCVAASMFGMQKPGSPNLPLEAIAERYVAVLDLGKKMDVRPLLEYWGHSVNLFRLEDALEVVRLTGRDDAAILADVYHTYRGGGSFDAYRKLSAKLLPVLHVNDYPSYPYREQLKDPDRVWPGDGNAPWRKIFSDLAAVGADPWLSIELFNPSYWRTYPARTLAEGFEKLKAVAG
ncbi:MAG: sugar phosphate isomerase/epimerase [Kiritimatiellae bacterium]|nr:sugar phosphate isomerase/epimerase [Kiritimatiellia bacterium]